MAPPKKIMAVVKIQLEAGSATPAPPVGTALGPHGIQTVDFCKQYNDQTESMRGQTVPVEISIYEDRTFSFILKTPPTPFLIRQAAGIAKGSQTAGRETVASVTMDQVEEIAKVKLPDLNTDDIEMAKLQVAGTARSMGINVAN
jgi:large subunit ribosomal protein L11